MEPALEGILCETEEEAAAVKLEVNPAARQVALMFAAEEDEASASGERAGTSGASPEASLSPGPPAEWRATGESCLVVFLLVSLPLVRSLLLFL